MFILTSPRLGDPLLVEYGRFPGGEIYLMPNLTDFQGIEVGIFAHITSSDDLMALCLLRDALARRNAGAVDLVMPYIPYARQDRVEASKGGANESLSIAVFANILNSLKFDSVTVFDPHSDVSIALIHRVKVINQWEYLGKSCIPFDESTVFVSPDAGAMKKIAKAADFYRLPVVCASKTRDPATGKLGNVVVPDVESLNGKRVVIVDDICDGGRTFINLAAHIRQNASPKSMILYVTHGIFSQGFAPLMEHFDAVFGLFTWEPGHKCKEFSDSQRHQIPKTVIMHPPLMPRLNDWRRSLVSAPLLPQSVLVQNQK